jgi:hypothetical protein
MVQWYMNDGLEVFDLGLIYYPSICLKGLRKSTKYLRITGVLAEI